MLFMKTNCLKQSSFKKEIFKSKKFLKFKKEFLKILKEIDNLIKEEIIEI